MSIAAGLVGGEAFSIDASLIKADVDKKKRIPGDQPIAWPKAEEASHAVREYLAALDTARGDEDRGGDDGSGEGGQRRRPPKEVSLTDPQATWVARPGLDPFFAYDANYLIDNKVGIIIDAVGTRANRTVEIAVTQTMVDRVERRFDLRPQRLAGDTVYGAVRLLKWLVDRNIALLPRHIQPCRLRLRPGSQYLSLPRRSGTDQHRQYRPMPHRLLQGQQERLLALLIQTEVHDSGRAQNHPRPQRRCTRSRPCIGQYGSLPAVAPRTQEGRDAICAHETDPRARPVPTAGLKWHQGRGAAHSNCTEPEAARQASLPCPATYIRGLPCVGVASSVDSVAQLPPTGARPTNRESSKQSQQSKPE